MVSIEKLWQMSQTTEFGCGMLFGIALSVIVFLYFDYRQFRDKADAEDRFERAVWKQEEQERLNALKEDSHTDRNEALSRL